MSGDSRPAFAYHSDDRPADSRGRFVVSRSAKLLLPFLVASGLSLTACAPSFSPDTYSASAVQQANKVERAVVIGFRQVKISTNGTVGAVSGGAAGGILGSQADLIGVNSALGTVGGSAVGGLLGTWIEHVTSDTEGWEYIVRKSNGDLLSVTQKETRPLAIGQKVLVITGNQARIIPDYSTGDAPPVAPETPKDGAPKEDVKKEGAGTDGAKEAPKAAPTDAAVPATDGKVEVKELPPPAGAVAEPSASAVASPADMKPAATPPAATPSAATPSAATTPTETPTAPASVPPSAVISPNAATAAPIPLIPSATTTTTTTEGGSPSTAAQTPEPAPAQTQAQPAPTAETSVTPAPTATTTP